MVISVKAEEGEEAEGEENFVVSVTVSQIDETSFVLDEEKEVLMSGEDLFQIDDSLDGMSPQSEWVNVLFYYRWIDWQSFSCISYYINLFIFH